MTKKQPSNTFETLMKHFKALLKHLWKTLETLMKHCWNIDETLMKYLWNSDEIPMKHQWNIGETLLTINTLVKHRWNTSETLVKYWWDTGEIPVFYQWDTGDSGGTLVNPISAGGGGSLGPRATLKPRRTPLLYSKLVQISWEFLSIYLLTKYPKKFKFFWGGAPLSAP